jgi:hypothetical protein
LRGEVSSTDLRGAVTSAVVMECAVTMPAVME